MNKNKISYYKIHDDEIIFHATFWKRFGARAIDFIIAGIIGKLILTIYSSTTVPGIPANPLYPSFENYILDYYDTTMMIGWAFVIVGYILTLWVFPLLNKKNPGQTMGKMLLKITPMYLHNKKPYKSILIRESFISLLQIFSLLFIAINGIDATYLYAQYQNYTHAFGETVPYPVETTYWGFVNNVLTDEYFMGSKVADTQMIVLSYFAKIFNIIWFTVLIVITLTIAFLPNRRGLHDLIANTTVVNLKSKMKEKDYLKIHIPATPETLDGNLPPAVLKK